MLWKRWKYNAEAFRRERKNGTAGIADQYIGRLSQAEIEKVRAAADAVGLPYCEKPYCDDFDPYTYDGNMSLQNLEIMHRTMTEGG